MSKRFNIYTNIELLLELEKRNNKFKNTPQGKKIEKEILQCWYDLAVNLDSPVKKHFHKWFKGDRDERNL